MAESAYSHYSYSAWKVLIDSRKSLLLLQNLRRLDQATVLGNACVSTWILKQWQLLQLFCRVYCIHACKVPDAVGAEDAVMAAGSR